MISCVSVHIYLLESILFDPLRIQFVLFGHIVLAQMGQGLASIQSFSQPEGCKTVDILAE